MPLIRILNEADPHVFDHMRYPATHKPRRAAQHPACLSFLPSTTGAKVYGHQATLHVLHRDRLSHELSTPRIHRRITPQTLLRSFELGHVLSIEPGVPSRKRIETQRA